MLAILIYMMKRIINSSVHSLKPIFSNVPEFLEWSTYKNVKYIILQNYILKVEVIIISEQVKNVTSCSHDYITSTPFLNFEVLFKSNILWLI